MSFVGFRRRAGGFGFLRVRYQHRFVAMPVPLRTWVTCEGRGTGGNATVQRLIGSSGWVLAETFSDIARKKKKNKSKNKGDSFPRRPEKCEVEMFRDGFGNQTCWTRGHQQGRAVAALGQARIDLAVKVLGGWPCGN